MTKALVVPADPSKKPNVVDIGHSDDHLTRLQRLVGGSVEVFKVDEDSTPWLNEYGRVEGLLRNHRVSDYFVHESDQAKAGQTQDAEPWFTVYGDVVFTGVADAEGNTTDVPERLVELFGREAQQALDVGL